MDFGEWVLSKRREQGLDIQSFARKTRVNAGTISRIENSRAQPTLYSAFRLTEGSGTTLSMLLKDLGEEQKQTEQRDLLDESSILTFSDVEFLVDKFHSKGNEVGLYLVSLLNKLYSFLEHRLSTRKNLPSSRKDELPSAADEFFSERDIDMFLSSSALYHFDFKYPYYIEPTIIISTFHSKGAMIHNDIVTVMRSFSTHSFDLSKSSNKFFERIASEAGSFERIRLDEIMTIDQELSLNGELLSIFWEICRFDEKFNPPVVRSKYSGQDNLFSTEDDDIYFQEKFSSKSSVDCRVATLYVMIYRWYQYMANAGQSLSFEKYAS